MQRSSDSIGALAAALAKAQGELTNPEKTLTATLPPLGPGADGAGAGAGGSEPRSFRYASLASGPEIVRQCLGRHEIAVMQTTALDQAADLVRPTTMLVHASREWVSSEWPVCSVSEMTNPQRMGAAPTYSRRYGLFTLVGIAGEDDLDAPNLNSGASAASPKANGRSKRERPRQWFRSADGPAVVPAANICKCGQWAPAAERRPPAAPAGRPVGARARPAARRAWLPCRR